MGTYHKTVRYRLDIIEANSYRPNKPGINISLGDYDHVNHEVTIHYGCTDHPMLPPEQRRTMEDIEDEIRCMESRIVKDTHVELKLPFHHATKFILDHHAMDGQYDHLRSVAVNKVTVKIPKFEIKEVNKYYEKQGIKPLDENQTEFEVGEVIDR